MSDRIQVGMTQVVSIHELSSLEATHICWESTFAKH